MGRPRRGKKAWRANISTKDMDDYVEKVAKEERSGGPLDALPNHSLFFLDKHGNSQLEKKTRRHEEKVLHCDSILKRNSLVPPLPKPLKRRRKEKNALKYLKKGSQPHQMVKENPSGAKLDIWSSEDKENKSHGFNNKAISKKETLVAPAVEVDLPGSSYNPSFEEHQEALALAVAQEMQTVYKEELEPPTVPRTVPGKPVDEEEMYFLEVDDEDVDSDDSQDTHKDSSLGSRSAKVKRRTRTEINRKVRREANLKVEEEQKKRALVKNDIQRLDEIIDEITIEEEEKHRRQIRRRIAKQEKLQNRPPKLGKLKFQSAPVQVLLSSEVTGSLRKLKGCCTLLRERFKSLQRRGILEPRVPAKRKIKRKRVVYEEGSKGRMERILHAARNNQPDIRK